MVTAETLQKAMDEAGRFTMAAAAAIRRIETEGGKWVPSCKEVAATKRASMDLTRALAELRRRG